MNVPAISWARRPALVRDLSRGPRAVFIVGFRRAAIEPREIPIVKCIARGLCTRDAIMLEVELHHAPQATSGQIWSMAGYQILNRPNAAAGALPGAGLVLGHFRPFVPAGKRNGNERPLRNHANNAPAPIMARAASGATPYNHAPEVKNCGFDLGNATASTPTCTIIRASPFK